MISDFRGEYRWLSNFHLVPVRFEELTFPSTEHAYQAAKTLDFELRTFFADPVLPCRDAKRIGGSLKLREDWEQIKVSVMEAVLREKFKVPELAAKLLATGDEELVEGNTWGDTFWGVCAGKGKNNLGKLLMKIREEVKGH